MKRFHVNVSVANLEQSVEFYTTLFGQEPDLLKDDYAKWMVEDPRVNFAISQSSRSRGVNHIGLQADTLDELGEIQERLKQAGTQTLDQPEAECCYARSSKTWVQDPDAVRWETFVTFGQNAHYGDDELPDTDASTASRCCA
jgi:predicted lactoylglutathione lyase